MHQFDIVIVGAGTAGMPCAILAAEAGARVAVIEKDGEVGGTLHVSAGQMSAAGSRRQRERGIEDSPDEHFAEVMELGRGQNDPAIVRLAVDEAPRTIDWLDELGIELPDDMPVVYYGHDPYTRARTYWGSEMGVTILKAIRPRFLQLVDRGDVDLRLEHRMTGLLIEDGAVVGVRAECRGGAVELRGASTVLASGGYTGDQELFRELHPGVRCLVGGRHTSTGDGLRAALAIGAGSRGFEHHMPSAGAIETPYGSGRVDFWEAWANTMPYYRKAREIHVNERGERYMDEDDLSADTRERRLIEQGDRMWIVFDEAAIVEDDPLVIGWSTDMLRAKASRGEGVWVGDTPEDVAAEAGIDPAGLARTIADVNEIVRGERPDPFGRASFPAELATPPYYAVASESGTVVGFGGVCVDGDLRVTRADGEPIPGLYAAGEVIGGAATMGNAYCGGMCVTPAMSLGRILGRRLAAAAR